MVVTMNGRTRIDTADTRLVPITVDGHTTRVIAGDGAVILQYIGERFNSRIEKLVTFYAWRSLAVNTASGGIGNSNHLSGTAVDCNGSRHPRFRHGTFSNAQVAQIRSMLGDLNQAAGATIVRWGGDWGKQVDEMHFELVGTNAQWAKAAAWIRSLKPAPAPAPEQPVEEEDEMRMYLARVTGTKGVYIGNGITRRLIANEQELADIQWRFKVGQFQGDPTVHEVARIGWLGVLVK